jgi:hypothetical protein
MVAPSGEGGDWLERGGELIAIGKTRIPCAIGHALIEAGHRVFHARSSDLVQGLQAARRDRVPDRRMAWQPSGDTSR